MRRKLSRTHWAARLLGVSVPKGHNPSPGLIMIQIDGLSRPQFEKALANRNLPHLARVLKRQQFHLHSFYSGVPSTTPAVQGELFYGVRAAVPAFQFLHRESGEVFRMYEAKSSEVIENKLREKGGKPLIEGGHTYSNIYRAGSAGSWYCSQDLSPAVMWRKARPLKWLLLSAVYIIKILRLLSLAVFEIFLAFSDCVRGLFERQNLLRELLFIPARVGICIMLREFIRFRVLLDIERGAVDVTDRGIDALQRPVGEGGVRTTARSAPPPTSWRTTVLWRKPWPKFSPKGLWRPIPSWMRAGRRRWSAPPTGGRSSNPTKGRNRSVEMKSSWQPWGLSVMCISPSDWPGM
ncbi:MAG: hypothetical protein EOP87_14530, partial [Verrucomicrobiaceae bacterium]